MTITDDFQRQQASAARRARSAQSLYRYIGLSLVLTMCGAWYAWHTYFSPPSVDGQIARALGCGSRQEILILHLQLDGRVRWPDGSICTVQKSRLLMPSWCKGRDEPALAILATSDMPTAWALPLLDTANELGMRRGVLAVSDSGNVRRISPD